MGGDVVSGGSLSATNKIDSFTIQTLSNATDHGDLTSTSNRLNSAASGNAA